MVEIYATNVTMFSDSAIEGKLTIKRCIAIDNVCHSQEDHDIDFFFMYACLFTNSHVRVLFDEFTMGVLGTLNVTPTQLHLNSSVALSLLTFG